MAMKLRVSGRRPMSPESRAGIGAAIVLLVVIAAVDVADGSNAHYIGLYAAAPFLAAAFASWPAIVAVGGLATVVGAIFGMYGTEPDRPDRGERRRDRAGHRYRGRARYGASASSRAGRRAFPAGDRRPGGRPDPARSAGRAACRGRPLHLGERRGRHRRRPLRGAGHAVRRTDDHRRRTGQGPRRRTCGQHRARLVPACGLRAAGPRHDRVRSRSGRGTVRRRRGLRHRRARRGARRHPDHRQLRAPGAAAAAPR